MANDINTKKIEVQLNPVTVSGQGGIPVRVQGLQGPPGPQGSPGFWLSETPPDEDSDIEVWIDPNGEETPLVTTVNGQTGNVVVQSRHTELSNTDILDIWDNI